MAGNEPLVVANDPATLPIGCVKSELIDGAPGRSRGGFSITSILPKNIGRCAQRNIRRSEISDEMRARLSPGYYSCQSAKGKC
jgi:hypothetical protein